MTAPDRTERPTEGTAGVLAAHAEAERMKHPTLVHMIHVRCRCGQILPTVEAYHRHFAAVLDAHVTERCAKTLEEAARDLPGFDGIRTHGDAAHWLRDRAAAMRGEG